MQAKVMKLSKVLFLIFLWTFMGIGNNAYSQDTIQVSVRANVQKDKIQLRWIADNSLSWSFTNENGIQIERYTIMKDGVLLDKPIKLTLNTNPIKPPPLDEWENIAQEDGYAAIIAQALYGESFEISGGTPGIAEIIATSQEREQRYSMSGLAAEMSYKAALFAGWGYEDSDVRKGESYLYRIIPVDPSNLQVIELGSAYACIDDYQELPRPIEFNAFWGDGNVLVSWNSKLLETFYSSYRLEYSRDGVSFQSVSDRPLTNITGHEQMFFSDSIDNDEIYYYRLAGITPFNEVGQYSDTIQGKGVAKLAYTPIITSVTPESNGHILINWEFDERANKLIDSFQLRRGNSDKGPFAPVALNIPPIERSFSYENPEPTNYLIIVAISKDNTVETSSFPHMVIMEDSIPPSIPTHLEGEIDSIGRVHLSWNSNTEADLLGYRIYRSQTTGEEPIPLTDTAVEKNEYTDSININNLNSKVYYAITSLDKRYNQSNLSEILEIEKPDLIPPSPPFINKYEATTQGIHLSWVSGEEATLGGYLVFREQSGSAHKELIATINSPDKISYIDSIVTGGISYKYEVFSISKYGLKSDPSPEVSLLAKTTDKYKGKINRFSSTMSTEGVKLKWQIQLADIRSISIYKKEADQHFSLWKSMDLWDREIVDPDVKRNTKYTYLLVIKPKDGIPIKAETTIN